MIHFILWPLVITWSFLGALFYARIADEIPNRWKKHLARVISGPLVWFFCILGYILDSMAWLDNIYTQFTRWLRQP